MCPTKEKRRILCRVNHNIPLPDPFILFPYLYYRYCDCDAVGVCINDIMHQPQLVNLSTRKKMNAAAKSTNRRTFIYNKESVWYINGCDVNCVCARKISAFSMAQHTPSRYLIFPLTPAFQSLIVMGVLTDVQTSVHLYMGQTTSSAPISKLRQWLFIHLHYKFSGVLHKQLELTNGLLHQKHRIWLTYTFGHSLKH